MIITGKSLPRRTFLKGVGAAVALPFLDSMAPAFAAPAGQRRRYAPRLPVRAERHRHEELERRRGGRALGEFPRVMKPLEAFRNDMIQIGNLTHNSGRALLDGAGDHGRCCRVLPDRHPGQEDHRRHQGQHLLRSDHRQQDWPPDAVRVARARHGRLAPGRRLRLGLLLRLHEQPGVAQRDAAAAADPRPARAVRAAVRHGRRAQSRGDRIGARATAAASSTSSSATRRSCSRRSVRPTGASSTSTCRRFAKSNVSS